MHPANVFIDVVTEKPICIDCIVKFINWTERRLLLYQPLNLTVESFFCAILIP